MVPSQPSNPIFRDAKSWFANTAGWLLVAVLSLVMLVPATADAGGGPIIDEPVNDYVGIYTDAETEALNQRLYRHHRDTGVQMAVLVVATTGPNHTIESFSLEAAQRWGGGDAERDDGLLFTLAIGDRENRIELGYGLEPVIPDRYAQQTLDDIAPLLRQEEYAAATHRVIDDVVAATEHLDPGGERQMHWSTFLESLGGRLVFVVFLSLIVGYAVGRRHLVGSEEGDDDSGDGDDVAPLAETVQQFDAVSYALVAGCLVAGVLVGSDVVEMTAYVFVVMFSLIVALIVEAFFRDSYILAAGSLVLFAAVYLLFLILLGYPLVENSALESVIMNATVAFMGGVTLYIVWGLVVFHGAESVAPGRTYLSADSLVDSSSSGGSSSGGSFGGGGGSFGGGGASGSW